MNKSWAQVFGARICRARKEAKLSQDEVAAHLGVWRAAVSQWERGLTEPTSQHLIRLIHLLGPGLLGSPDDPFISDAEPEEVPSAEKLAAMIRAGLSDRQIADHLGVHPSMCSSGAARIISDGRGEGRPVTDPRPPDEHRGRVLSRIDEIRAELEREDLTNGEQLLLIDLAVLTSRSLYETAELLPYRPGSPG